MRSIHYTDGEFLTGTDIAQALLDYARSLAGVSESAAVDIPIVGPHGEVIAATILLGPASQLITVDVVDYDGDELEDPQLVARIHELAAKTARPIGRPLPSDGLPIWDNIDDLP